MRRKKVPLPVQKSLIAQHAGECARCSTPVVTGEQVFIGEIAHIVGVRPGASRYDPDFPRSRLHELDNLLLLCPNCHTEIDKHPSRFTVDELRQMKTAHIQALERRRQRAGVEVTFAELDVIVRYLTKASPSPKSPETLRLTAIKEKTKRNGLSREVENLIQMGLAGISQVQDYLNRQPDPDFAQRLKAGFVHTYREHMERGLRGDTLFYALLEWAYGPYQELKYQAAALKVLTYFFEICEVFEP